MKQVFKSLSFIVLLKNADEEWEKLNAAAEKKETMKRFVDQEFGN